MVTVGIRPPRVTAPAASVTDAPRQTGGSPCGPGFAAIVQEEKVVYGINTGFGSLCHTIISKADTQKLQENLIRSHSVGVGDPVPESITRLMLILKIHALSLGFSGISLNVIRRMIWLLEKNQLD